MKRLALLAALPLALVVGCKATPPWLSLPPPTQQQGVEVEVDGVLKTAQTISAVTGKAVNRTGADLGRCTLSFEAFGIHGERLATARAQIEDWAAGDTWSFRADFPRALDNATTISSPRITLVR